MKKVYINESKIRQYLAQKIAEYWDGKIINVAVPSGAQWSDFYIDPATNTRQRVPGSFDKVTDITGVIEATAQGEQVTFHIVYNVTITNVG